MTSKLKEVNFQRSFEKEDISVCRYIERHSRPFSITEVYTEQTPLLSNIYHALISTSSTHYTVKFKQCSGFLSGLKHEISLFETQFFKPFQGVVPYVCLCLQ